MSIGTLLAKIVLDEPKKVHYGSSDKVKGKVVLTYTPSSKTRMESNPELFGPLQLVVTLHGRSKSKVYKSNGNSTSIYRGRVPLFYQRLKLFDDSFRAKPNQPHNFPFTLPFPAFAPGDGGAFWEYDGLFNYKEGDPLPPSWSNKYHGFSNRYEAFVEYRMGVHVAMPRLQIIIVKPEKYNEPLVYYDKPRLSAPINERPRPTKGLETVQNEMLLPEADRPTGFKQKAKAALSSNYYPTYAFDWTLLAPQNLYVGQPVVFEVSIRPRDSNTAVLIPDVHLSTFYAHFKAQANVRAEKQIFSHPSSHSDEEIFVLNGYSADKGPFGKANDWTKSIETRPLRGGRGMLICSTFSTPNISLSWKMEITGSFTFAGKTKTFSRQFAVTVHPELERQIEQAGSSAAAGSSSQALEMGSMDAALPQYDRPPEYEEAVNEASEVESSNKKESEWPVEVDAHGEMRLH